MANGAGHKRTVLKADPPLQLSAVSGKRCPGFYRVSTYRLWHRLLIKKPAQKKEPVKVPVWQDLIDRPNQTRGFVHGQLFYFFVVIENLESVITARVSPITG